MVEVEEVVEAEKAAVDSVEVVEVEVEVGDYCSMQQSHLFGVLSDLYQMDASLEEDFPQLCVVYNSFCPDNIELRSNLTTIYTNLFLHSIPHSSVHLH